MTDFFYEIWHGDVARLSGAPQLIKFENVKSKMAAATILKNKKITITAMDWWILTKFGTIMHLVSPDPVSQ